MGVFYLIVYFVSWIIVSFVAQGREDSLQSKLPVRTTHLSDYLKAMGFDARQPVGIAFGQPLVATAGQVKSSGFSSSELAQARLQRTWSQRSTTRSR
jgi:hypothetical protein